MKKHVAVYGYTNHSAMQVARFRRAGSIPSGITDEQAEAILAVAEHYAIAPLVALSQLRIKEEGKTVMSFELFRSIVQRSGLILYEQRIDNQNECTVCLTHISMTVEQATFSLQQASKQKLLQKESWKKDAEEMLYERAYMKAVRKLLPQLTVGITLENEYEKSKTLFEKVLAFFLRFMKSKKVERRFIKVSLSQNFRAYQQVEPASENPTKAFAKEAVSRIKITNTKVL